MLKRLSWFTIGLGLGVALTLRANRIVRRTVDRYVPEPFARRLRTFNAALDERRAVIRARKAGGTVD